MKKLSKAILIAVGALAATGIAFVVFLNLYIQSPGSQARIQEELSKSLRLPLKLTNVSVSPFGSLKITGITIPNGDANFLEAASFDARYRLLPLLHGRLIITEMKVQSPKVVWVQSPKGQWKLPEPEKAAKTAATEAKNEAVAKAEETQPKAEAEKTAEKTVEQKKGRFAVIVERFNVNGGSVELVDREGKHFAVLTDVTMVFTSLNADRVEGTANIGKAAWADSITFDNVSAPFKYTDEEFTVPEVTAAVAGGKIQGKYRIQENKDHSPFKAALTLTGIDLDQLATQAGNPAGQTVGTLGGQVELHGEAEQTDRVQGDGYLDLRNAQFHQLDLFQNIGQILGLKEFADLRVRDGHTDFHVGGGKIRIVKLALNTADLQLAATGTVHFDKSMRLDAKLSAEDAVVQRLPGMIRDNFGPNDSGRRAIDFTVNGSIDKPKTNLLDKFVKVKIDGQFTQILGALLNTEKKPEEVKKEEKPEDKKSEKERRKKDKDKDKEREKQKAAEQNKATTPAANPAPADATPPPAAPAPTAPPPPVAPAQ